jgi:RimJ/RimL family protein N-acetyltransferase
MFPFVGVSLEFHVPRRLGARERAECLALAETVLHVDRDWFESTFDRYDEVILYKRRRTGALIGVTGLRLIDTEHEGDGVRLFYTGSVVLHPDWRGRGLVPWAGLRAIARHGTTARRLYWLMETDSWRAYALAAGNTRDCWPRDAALAPNPLYDHVCKSVYRDEWDAERRVCRPIAQRRLRPEVAHIPPAARASNRHARAYAALNPGHVDGDALPVLVPLDADNIAHFAWRMCLHAARPSRGRR